MKKISELRPPRMEDFSEARIKKSVLMSTLQHPITLFPAAAGVLCTLAGALLEPALFAVAIGGVTLSLGAWIVNYFFRSEAYSGKYIEALQKALSEHKEQVIANIEREITLFYDLPDAQCYVEQGQNQFQLAERKFANYTEMLGRRFNTTEITYGRYYATAEQVYLSILDNLQEMIDSLKSIREIDVDYINDRLQKLANLSVREEADDKEEETLNESLKLRQKQLTKINQLLTENEAALTSIDRAAVALSDIQTSEGHSGMELDSAREELEKLAQRARDYSIRA